MGDSALGDKPSFIPPEALNITRSYGIPDSLVEALYVNMDMADEDWIRLGKTLFGDPDKLEQESFLSRIMGSGAKAPAHEYPTRHLKANREDRANDPNQTAFPRLEMGTAQAAPVSKSPKKAPIKPRAKPARTNKPASKPKPRTAGDKLISDLF